MPHGHRHDSPHRRRALVASAVLLVVVMWGAAATQFAGGVFDLAVFAPPGAALGLVSTWSAHAFAPERFTWHRGMIGAVVGGLAVSPLITFLVAFAAAWEPASFQFVFNLGAWLAIAGGLATGGSGWVVDRVMHWRHARTVARP